MQILVGVGRISRTIRSGVGMIKRINRITRSGVGRISRTIRSGVGRIKRINRITRSGVGRISRIIRSGVGMIKRINRIQVQYFCPKSENQGPGFKGLNGQM